MNVTCPICAQPLRPDGFGVVALGARGNAWVRVHDGHCQTIAMSGVRTAIHGLVYFGRRMLARKAPAVSVLLEDFADYRRRSLGSEGSATDGR